MKTNILICAKKECLGDIIDFPQIKKYFESKRHEVIIHENFCLEINNLKFISPFNVPERPTVFAGCSPLVMENRIKTLFDAPVEIANIREQCSWACEEPDIATKLCKEIIYLAVNQIVYTKRYNPPDNVLKQKLAEYESVIKKIGPNPFKL